MLFVDYKDTFICTCFFCDTQIAINTYPPAALRATAASSSSMLPSSMYHKDRTAQHSALSPESLVLKYVRVYWYVYTAAVYCCLLVFLLSPLIVLSRSSCSFRNLHPCSRSRDIASKHAAHHRAASSAQVALGIIKSLVAPNHGPLLSAPITFCCLLPYASVGGVYVPPAEGSS